MPGIIRGAGCFERFREPCDARVTLFVVRFAVYVEAASYEAIVRALDQLTLDIEKVITSASGAEANQINADHVKRISARIASVRLDLSARSDRIYQQMARARSFMEQVEHIERSLLGNAAQNIASRWGTRN